MAKTAEKNRIAAALDEAQLSNGGKSSVDFMKPYVARVQIIGVAPILLHAWNVESVEAKGKAAKGSKAKKEDDLESYVYRTTDGFLGVAGKNLHGAIVEAARYHQDPRSPRKSLRDLCKAAIIPLTIVAPFEPKTKTWDYEDRQRVVIQRSAITRTRPAMKEGWKLTIDLQITLPEYVPQEKLAHLIVDAGRLSGLCDYRPTYGRFTLGNLSVVE